MQHIQKHLFVTQGWQGPPALCAGKAADVGEFECADRIRLLPLLVVGGLCPGIMLEAARLLNFASTGHKGH